MERANRTLQDRLVKELRLDNVCDMEAGNAFLSEFLLRYNEHFAVQPLRPEDLHRSLNGVKVSRETLRKWMIEDGLWLSRRQRRSFHQPRLRLVRTRHKERELHESHR